MISSIFPVSVYSQLEYTGIEPSCKQPLKSSDFKVTELFNATDTTGVAALGRDSTLDEPVNMSLDAIYKQDGTVDYMNVYFVERGGKIKFYNGLTHSVTVIGKMKTFNKADNSLTGIALHPNFKENKRVFFWFAPKRTKLDTNYYMRLSYFLVDSQNQIDFGSEKILINYEVNRVKYKHSGGPMTFDSKGDLWINFGNNSEDHNKGFQFSHLSQTDSIFSDEWGSSNTSSMRGSILRIHPDDSEKGYSIPQGNFGEYWANQFAIDSDPTNDSWVADYRDTAKVLPEIYTKGHRSNFSIAVHPTKHWMTWGDVGFGPYDEFNLVAHPVFAGYPYFIGKDKRVDGQLEILGKLQDINYPKNNSPLKGKGVVNLPPSWQDALFGKKYSTVAMTGPFYAYNNKPESKKFPPHFNNTWMTFNWNNKGNIWIHSIDEATVKIDKSQRIDTTLFSDLSLRAPIQGVYGEDGAFYLLNYGGGAYNNRNNPGVVRVEYVGTCQPVVSTLSKQKRNLLIDVNSTGISIQEEGRHTVSLSNVAGQEVWSAVNSQPKSYQFSKVLPASLQKGVYITKIVTLSGVEARKVFVY